MNNYLYTILLCLFVVSANSKITNFEAECNLSLPFVKKSKITATFSLEEESRSLKGNFFVSTKDKSQWSWTEREEVFLRGVLDLDAQDPKFNFVDVDKKFDLRFISITPKNSEVYSGVIDSKGSFYPTECVINEI